MIPQIFSLGPLPINSFGLMIALSIISGGILLARSFSSNGINSKLAEKYILTGSLVGLLGARIWYVFIDNFSELKGQLFSALFSSAGFTFFGGFIISTVVLIIMTKLDKIPLNKFLDSVGPCMAIGYAIGRLGCQLSGDGDYGILTENFLGMSYQTGVVPTPLGAKAYPTPLYESTICLIITWYLVNVETKKNWQEIPYKRFGLYLSLIGLERLLVEFIRINPPVFLIFSQAQLISIILVLIGFFLVFRQKIPFGKQ